MSVQVQESQNIAPACIFDRKNFILKENYKKMDSTIPSAFKRQLVLTSQSADGLSDGELKSHLNEINIRKFFKWITFVSIPGSLYFYKLPPLIVALSLIPACCISQKVYNSLFFNTRTSFSFTLAEKSQKRHYNLIVRANGRELITPETRWNEQIQMAKYLPIKDWLARHEYR